MTAAVSASLDAREVFRALDRLGRFGRDLTPVFRKAKRPLLDDQREHARRQEGPDGKWPPRASSTRSRLDRSRRRRRPARALLGKLPAAIKVTIDRNGIVGRSRVWWSGAHQDGPTRVGRGAVVPRRVFYWPSDGLLRKVVDIIGAELGRAWGGAG